MMEKFKTVQVQCEYVSEAAPEEVKIVKVEGPTQTSVREFKLPTLKKKGERDYAFVKEKYGALAATDMDRAARNAKDRRFSLSPLLRDPLSVEQEERRAIDEKVRSQVEAVSEEARKNAAKIGYQDGLKQGHEEAFAKFKTEAASRLNGLDALINAFESAKAEVYQANERFLVELIYQLSRMILLKELQVDKEYLIRLARELIEKVGVRENLTIRIHPSDAETIQMLKDSLDGSFGGLRNLKIEASNQVKAGGCQVETQWNAIDASLETQFQGLYEGIFGKRTQ